MTLLAQQPLPETFGPFLALRESLGFVPNILREQSLLPRAIEAEAGIAGAVLLGEGVLPRAFKESIVVAIAARHGSAYCFTSHGQILRSLGVEEQEIHWLVADAGRARLSATHRALLDFSLKLAERPASIAGGDVQGLRDRGCSDEQILEAVVTTGLARFLCSLSAGLAPALDFEPRALPARQAPLPGTESVAAGPLGPGTAGPYLRAPAREAESFAPFAFFLDKFGFIPNIFRAQTLRPDIVEAEAGAVDAILLTSDVLSRARKEYILLVISAANLNTYCVAVHCELLRALGVSEEISDQIAVDHHLAELSEPDRALLDFVLKLATRPGEFAEPDVEALRRHGFSDQQILEAIVMTALTNFLNTLQMGLGTVPDFHPRRVFGVNLSAEPPRPMGQAEGPQTSDDPIDARLVERARNSDVDAFEELVKRHERRVFRTLLGITGSVEDAEDGAQRVFLKAWEHLGDFRKTSKFSTWLTRIAVNEGIERVRSRRPSISLDETTAEEEGAFRPRDLQAWADDPETACARSELRELVEKQLMELPHRYRIAVLLRDLEQLSTAEAATLLGIAIPTLKTHLLRGRMMLREALAPLLADR